MMKVVYYSVNGVRYNKKLVNEIREFFTKYTTHIWNNKRVMEYMNNKNIKTKEDWKNKLKGD